MNKKATWLKAGLEFAGAVIFILAVRWALFEPYAIPSGSMLPTLLIHDHILVNKFAYGLRAPFQKTYLLRWGSPKLGEVIVFRHVEDPDVYFVKRVVGLAGDSIEIKEDGVLYVNGEIPDFERIASDASSPFGPLTVPEGHVFTMGDNRDNSADSRVWGALPLDYVLGRASVIWLSCEETLHDASRVCDPKTVRWNRIFRLLK